MAVSPAEVQTYLADVDYPAQKVELLYVARREGAGDDVLEILEGIDDREYADPSDVSTELSGISL